MDLSTYAPFVDHWSDMRLRAKTAGYVRMTAFVILFYDSIITIADEVSEIKSFHSSSPTVHHCYVQVRLIWPGVLTFPKCLYYINRYLSIALSLYCISAPFYVSLNALFSKSFTRVEVDVRTQRFFQLQGYSIY